MKYSPTDIDFVERNRVLFKQDTGEKEKQSISLSCCLVGSWHDLSLTPFGPAVQLKGKYLMEIIHSIQLFVCGSHSQRRTIRALKECLAMSGEIWGCRSLGQGVLLHALGGGQPCHWTSCKAQGTSPKLKMIQPEVLEGWSWKILVYVNVYQRLAKYILVFYIVGYFSTIKVLLEYI